MADSVMRVDIGFKRKLKIEAAEQDMSILDYTRRLAKADDLMEEFKKPKNAKKFGFNM